MQQIPELDLKVVEKLDYQNVIKLLDQYDPYTYSIILRDFTQRTDIDENIDIMEQYQGLLFEWFIQNDEKIPINVLTDAIEYMIENSEVLNSNSLYVVIKKINGNGDSIPLEIMDLLLKNTHQYRPFEQYLVDGIFNILISEPVIFPKDYIYQKVVYIINKYKRKPFLKKILKESLMVSNNIDIIKLLLENISHTVDNEILPRVINKYFKKRYNQNYRQIIIEIITSQLISHEEIPGDNIKFNMFFDDKDLDYKLIEIMYEYGVVNSGHLAWDIIDSLLGEERYDEAKAIIDVVEKIDKQNN